MTDHPKCAGQMVKVAKRLIPEDSYGKDVFLASARSSLYAMAKRLKVDDHDISITTHLGSYSEGPQACLTTPDVRILLDPCDPKMPASYRRPGERTPDNSPQPLQWDDFLHYSKTAGIISSHCERVLEKDLCLAGASEPELF